MTYSFETYGCQMNYAESSSVEALLQERGWKAAKQIENANLILINTCSVRITAETRANARIAHHCGRKKKQPIKVLVFGCMAERLKNELKQMHPNLDYVVGMFERQIFEDIFSAIEDGRPYKKIDESPAGDYYFASSSYQSGSFQSFLPIMNGCNNFCSYCIVPYVRGREVSRPLKEILNEVSLLEEKGVREITLLGQNVNSYSWQNTETGEDINFPQLLTIICRHIEKKNTIRWLRFMSSHPKDFSDDLITVIAREKAICKFIHLPVQNGSNKILKEMNRKYSRETYLELVNKLRKELPGLAISSDILIGFPGETEDDVENTLSLIREVEFTAAFMYHYNPREGTKAFDLPNRIPEKVKKERLSRVIKLQHSISSELMKNRIGSIVEVLVESTSRNNKDELFGHNEFGEMVVFIDKLDKSLIGTFVKAKLTSLKGRTFRAKLV